MRPLGTIDYADAWELQRELLNARADGTGPDTLLLLEHPSVYTAGKRTEPADRPQAMRSPQTSAARSPPAISPCVRTGRSTARR